jgi:hypothetical protein
MSSIHSLRNPRQALHEFFELPMPNGIESGGYVLIDGFVKVAGTWMQGLKNRIAVFAPVFIFNRGVHHAPIQVQHVNDLVKFHLQSFICLVRRSIDLAHNCLPRQPRSEQRACSADEPACEIFMHGQRAAEPSRKTHRQLQLSQRRRAQFVAHARALGKTKNKHYCRKQYDGQYDALAKSSAAHRHIVPSV